jgi:dipeptidyl aminopeptidase/acylaminoacyl peptidase
VGELAWARRAPRLAWLEGYDPRVRSGSAGAGGPAARRTFGKNVTDVEISPDGRAVAYLQHTTRGGYSVDLFLAPVDGRAAPASVAPGVFGFSFSPDSAFLYYRTRCGRNGEACDLERVPAGGLPPGKPPEVIAQGVKSFEFDPRDAGRLLLGWQRADRAALDIGVWEGGRLVRVDAVVLPGSAFLLPGARRVAYVVLDPKRAGVYVADLPPPGGP